MYHVSAQGVDDRMINVHYYYYYCQTHDGTVITESIIRYTQYSSGSNDF